MHRKLVYQSLLLSMLALTLSGCLAQSQIQAKYMTREADCREEAQNRVANSPQTGMSALGYDSRIETAYTLSSGFSDCMNKQGWKVAVPKPPVTTTASTTPPPVGAPGQGGTVLARTPAPAAEPATTYPAARPVPVQGTAPATGYPNPAYNTYIPEYGKGAGRQF